MRRHGSTLQQLACAVLLVAALAAPQQAAADHKNHIYKPGEVVVLFANKVGPFHNPRCVQQQGNVGACVRAGGCSAAARMTRRAARRSCSRSGT
jgi:hypothetical protein